MTTIQWLRLDGDDYGIPRWFNALFLPFEIFVTVLEDWGLSD